ncbi:uncharacterized protein LOC112557675 [Pomacea canaliculata]|uniref:uncharacterized protein LOC112557675 n=1 Tax=Pomacea canaliculata TaxID=400727 RepID=UPI000D737C0B|nr:uncharacterized protein LOC112557675 [Pomacea canaliculata]
MDTATVVVLVATVLLGTEAANITVDMQVMQQWDDNWEGKFCFTLKQPIVGFQMVFTFSQGVKSIQQWVGNWQGSPADCSTTWTMLNQDSHGVHEAGEFCVRMMGRVCGTPSHLTGHGVLVDLTDDGQHVSPVPAIAGAQQTKYNYAEVLQKSILFYEAQRSGKLPASNRIPWRGDSALQDRGDKGEDLTGGWYDAGDNVKFNFPMAFSTTVLCWSLLEFKDAYDKAGQLDYMYDSIRWPLEYFIKCHTGPNELYVQVGTGSSDHGSWTSPERMDQNRKAYKVTAASPGSDVAGETAAAMACGAIAFQSKDKTFAEKLLQHSEQLFDFAQAHQGFYSSSVADAAAFYKSNNYSDEVSWSAGWLFKATNQNKYLEIAKKGYLPGPAWGFSWDEKLAGNMLLMYSFTNGEAQYRTDIEDSMKAWSKAGGMDYTPKCLAFRLQWGALRYSANMAFFALVAAKYGLHASDYRQWAMCQIHYALGDTGRSFVVGFGVNPPTRPHHRASSCPMLPAPCGWEAQQNPGPNPHVLYGALVGGPGGSDDYVDDRKDYVHNEVACDYNAGFQSAVAGLLQLALDHQLPEASRCGTC